MAASAFEIAEFRRAVANLAGSLPIPTGESFWESVRWIEDTRRAALTALLTKAPDDDAARLLMAEIQRSAEIIYQLAKDGRARRARR